MIFINYFVKHVIRLHTLPHARIQTHYNDLHLFKMQYTSGNRKLSNNSAHAMNVFQELSMWFARNFITNDKNMHATYYTFPFYVLFKAVKSRLNKFLKRMIQHPLKLQIHFTFQQSFHLQEQHETYVGRNKISLHIGFIVGIWIWHSVIMQTNHRYDTLLYERCKEIYRTDTLRIWTLNWFHFLTFFFSDKVYIQCYCKRMLASKTRKSSKLSNVNVPFP